MTESTTAVRFTILGPVAARRGGAELELGGRQQRLVLALLLAHAGSVVGITELVDTIWPQDPPASAINVVHRYIGTLRRLIEPDLPVRAVGSHLIRHAAGYRLKTDEQSLDLLRLRSLVAQARQTGEPTTAVRLFAEALTLWRGPCAAGLDTDARPHPAFAAIEAECAHAARDAADTALRCGQTRLIIPALRQAAALHPLDEALQARLMLALAADGRQAEAMETFQDVRRWLCDELGIDPSPELLDAYDRLLHQRITTRPQHGTPPPDPARSTARTDDGGHPDPASPPPNPARPVLPTPAQLPPDHPFFVGRTVILARAQELLDHDRRVGRAMALAVHGIAGIGKTTLAIHLGHRLAAAYPDGQLYADLRGSAADGRAMSPGEALRGFLSSLGVAPQHLPAELHALAGLYRSILAGRRILIVLDNGRDFEHVRHLLPGTAGCLAVVTSRHPLTGLLAAGRAHPLPLDLPPPEEAREYLIRRLGAERLAAQPAAVDDLIAGSGRLPLTLAVLAARAASRPDAPLAEFAASPVTTLPAASASRSWTCRAVRRGPGAHNMPFARWD